MAQVFDLREQKKNIDALLAKGTSSSNLNFLLGAGCSEPAISGLGVTEKEIDAAMRDNNSLKVEQLTYKFLSSIIEINLKLIAEIHEDKIENTRKIYSSFLSCLQNLLYKRKTSLHFNLINIFTTNYDLFVEEAASRLPDLFLNDGFCRNTNLQNRFYFSPAEFFHYRGHADYLYDYKTDLPVFNLIKLHGSLSWKLEQGSENRIFFNNDLPKSLPTEQSAEDSLRKYNQTCAVVLPSMQKHRTSVITDVYYDLIRLFSYELERPNSLFFAMGFSFKDEHLCKVIRRGLANPSLLFLAFAYSREDLSYLSEEFKDFNNFVIIKNTEEDEKNQAQHKNLDFQEIINHCLINFLSKDK
ncbi:hypothetical protein [Candidatus Avelusimicrobium sp.]|uniref:hypothetical protein n=1 Tax=Candidatus Avelusimicrobium sp. TaxID=3048833 RepID=UPI003F821895